MPCCGRNPAVRPGFAPAAPGAGPIVVTTRATTVRLRWRRRVTASVEGPVTRASYAVSANTPLITVDARDAPGLLATGFFVRVG